MTESDLVPEHHDGMLLGGARATALAMFALLAVNLAAIASSPMPQRGASVRLSHYQYEIGHALAVGLIAALVVAVWVRWGPRRPWIGAVALGAAATALGVPTLGQDLLGFSQEAAPGAWRTLLYGIIVGFGVVVGVTAWLGRLLGRPRFRWVGVGGGFAGLVANQVVLQNDYPAAHVFLVLVGMTGIAASLATAPVPRWWWRAKARLPLAVAFVVASISLLIRPDNAVMLEMLQRGGSVVATYQARSAFGGSQGFGVVPKKWEPWFAQRDDVDPIAPSKRSLSEGANVILLVTVDSLRADLMTKGKYNKKLKNLAKLRKDSIVFTQARAPGSQTVYTLAQMFASRYYSQMYWTKQKGIRDLWPHADESLRFPEILQKAGVTTMTAAGTYWLIGKHGIVRGFDTEEYEKPEKTLYQVSGWQLPKIIEHLENLGEDEPFFGYAHLLDAHYRVSPAKRKGAFKKYVANLKLIDKELGALRRYLETSEVGKRTILIVSSDHGEAFGEHGTKHHRVSLYEELVHVPLWIWAPGIKAKKLDTRVSIMDIGPTILDLFQQPAPGSYMGQSLVPLAVGEKKAAKKLTRPIVAEGRMKKALYFDNGMKAIVDDRNYTMELYNLEADPKELNNLIESDNSPGMARIGILRKFFETAGIQREGYTIPFRP